MVQQTFTQMPLGIHPWLASGTSGNVALLIDMELCAATLHLQDYADMAAMECLLIDSKTEVNNFQKELGGTMRTINWRMVYHVHGMMTGSLLRSEPTTTACRGKARIQTG